MKERAEVSAITLGPLNCEAALGVPWRWARDKARALGVPLIEIDGKTVIEADALLAAFKKHAVIYEAEATPEPGSPEELIAMRKKLGLQLRPTDPEYEARLDRQLAGLSQGVRKKRGVKKLKPP